MNESRSSGTPALTLSFSEMSVRSKVAQTLHERLNEPDPVAQIVLRRLIVRTESIRTH